MRSLSKDRNPILRRGVALVSFSGDCVSGEVLLNWQTASEYNSAYFIVERSVDGEIWNEIAQLSSAGFSNVLIPYSLVDYPHNSLNYYRLTQVDLDGEAGLLEVKHLLTNKPLSFVQAASSIKQFCLTLDKKHNTLSLKVTHIFNSKVQGQLNILQRPWCDLIFRTTNPHDIYIQRVHRDEQLWREQFIPKFTWFYMQCILP